MSRIFVGILLSAELKEKTKIWQSAHQNLPVRFIASKNLHITLLPPWEETNVDEAIKKFKKMELAIKPFEINFEKISLGPTPRKPSLVWASGKTPKELAGLKEAIEKVFGRGEKRPLKLHATLARLKRGKSDPPTFNKVEQTIDWRQTVNKIALLESSLLPEGADYTTLAETSLA